MTAISDYRQQLRQLDNWLPLLLAQSRLPGPRANLELAHAVAAEADDPWVERLLTFADATPNTPDEFVLFCGLLALGPRLALQPAALARLSPFAGDARWRIREAVATALQQWGDDDFAALLDEMGRWIRAGRYDQRAAVAALAEPRLLTRSDDAASVLALLDEATATLVGAPDRGSEPFRVLRQALGYAWSVAIAALPDVGMPLLIKWRAHADPDVAWVMRENLKKKRLQPWL
jgi:hypothetical protein